MDWLQVVAIILTIGGMLGASFKFMWSRIDKKFDLIDKKFELVNEKFKEIKNDTNERFSRLDGDFKIIQERLSGMEKSINSIDSRISKFEGKDEERFRHQLKLLVKENKKTEEEL